MAGGDDTRSATDQSTCTSPPVRDGELRAPTILVDRYQVERRLGSGGMGVVYAARDIHLGREVAVKLVSARTDVGSGQDRLVREAQAMAKLRHPNLATVHDIGLSGDRLFVVMELVDGGTVADWLKAAPRSWREIVAVYLQAARGLAAVHAAGFVHRDFKPENVLLGKDGVARVSDFGVARLLGDTAWVETGEGAADTTGSITGTGIAVGTPGYIAPEILRREAEDARADQFSFCVAMYAAFYGERPFAPREGADRITETLGVRRPLRAGSGPRWLSRIVVRGLAPDPRDRWPTMAALMSAIERRLARRRRALVASAVAAVAIAAAAIITARRTIPAPPRQWSPVVMGRTGDSPLLTMTVSPDGSTLASISATGASISPRVGAGASRRVVLPGEPDRMGSFRLSRKNDRLFWSVWSGPETWELWALDVATGRAERRVPSPAAPAISPWWIFDVGPEEEILFMGLGQRTAWRANRTGAVRHVMTADPGEWIDVAVWSPDGGRMAFGINSSGQSRIAILTLATGQVAVVSHRACATIQWLTDHSLVCAAVTLRRPVLIELLLPPDGGEATERIRFSGPEFQAVDILRPDYLLLASSAGVLFATQPSEMRLSLLALDAPQNIRAISSGGISDLPAAGWTSSGSLIFGTSIQGQLRIMRRFPDGRVETMRMGPASEVPLLVLGETIIFGRFPGGESSIPFVEPPLERRFPDGELFRLAPGGALTALGPTRGFENLLCAGGSPPCFLQEHAGDDVIMIDLDVETGARGRERARWNAKMYGSKSTLSPDGRTLAQFRRSLGIGDMSLLDLESGRRRSIARSGTEFFSPSFQPDGTLVALAWNYGSRNIVLVRVRDLDTLEDIAVVSARDAITFAGDFKLTDDGKTAAILMTGGPTTYWWAANDEE